MSTTDPRTDDYSCAVCGGERDPYNSIKGCCSRKCFHTKAGSNILTKIEHDHRFCASCYRQVKQIDAPTESQLSGLEPETARSVIGRQYPTPQTVWATDEQTGGNPYARIEYQRWGCECGAVNPNDQHDVLQQADPEQAVQSLFSCLRRLAVEDAVQTRPRKSVYLESVRKYGLDWPAVIGRTVHES